MSETYFLAKGNHATADDGRCAMEFVAYLAGEKHSDSPVCVSPLLRNYGISLNDVLPDDLRQRLRPLLARCIGTAGDGRDMERSWLATDWLIRTYVPAFMALTPSLTSHADELRALPAVLTQENLTRALDSLHTAWDAARAAAWAAARDAAGDAAGEAAGAVAGEVVWDAAGAAAADAVWDAAWAAARDAARDAAGEVAGAAARAAARAAAGAVARDVARDAARAAVWAAVWAVARAVARDAARDAAGDAAGEAARDAARDAAGDAAGAAARDALAPTVRELQITAIGLLDQMLPTELLVLPVAADADLICGYDLTGAQR